MNAEPGPPVHDNRHQGRIAARVSVFPPDNHCVGRQKYPFRWRPDVQFAATESTAVGPDSYFIGLSLLALIVLAIQDVQSFIVPNRLGQS